MIWPWTEIKRLQDQVRHEDQTHLHGYTMEHYLKLSLSMRGAHKGIWRLKQKLKKYEKERK